MGHRGPAGDGQTEGLAQLGPPQRCGVKVCECTRAVGSWEGGGEKEKRRGGERRGGERREEEGDREKGKKEERKDTKTEKEERGKEGDREV